MIPLLTFVIFSAISVFFHTIPLFVGFNKKEITMYRTLLIFLFLILIFFEEIVFLPFLNMLDK